MNYQKHTSNGLVLSPEELRAIRATLGDNIRRQRKRKNTTMEDLSHKAGIHVTFLGHIELGSKTPSIHTLVRIARALAVLPAVLLRGVR
jgi:transcriptional regulator with XRE-family HTH domain